MKSRGNLIGSCILIVSICCFLSCSDGITDSEQKTSNVYQSQLNERTNNVIVKKIAAALETSELEETLTYLNKKAYASHGYNDLTHQVPVMTRNREDGTWTVTFYAHAGYLTQTNYEDYIEKAGFYIQDRDIAWILNSFPAPTTSTYSSNYSYTYSGIANKTTLVYTPYVNYHTSLTPNKTEYHTGSCETLHLNGPEIYTFTTTPTYTCSTTYNGQTYSSSYTYLTVDGVKSTTTRYRWDENTTHTIEADANFMIVIDRPNSSSELFPRKFDHWSDGNTNRSRQITFSGNLNLTAVYVNDIHKVEF
jgi:hypothetical protein